MKKKSTIKLCSYVWVRVLVSPKLWRILSAGAYQCDKILCNTWTAWKITRNPKGCTSVRYAKKPATQNKRSKVRALGLCPLLCASVCARASVYVRVQNYVKKTTIGTFAYCLAWHQMVVAVVATIRSLFIVWLRLNSKLRLMANAILRAARAVKCV